MKNEMLMVSRNPAFFREVNFQSVNINTLTLLSSTILSESSIYKNKLLYYRAEDTLISKTQSPDSSFSRKEDGQTSHIIIFFHAEITIVKTKTQLISQSSCLATCRSI